MVTVWDESEGVVSSDKLMAILKKKGEEKSEEAISSLKKEMKNKKEDKENGTDKQ